MNNVCITYSTDGKQYLEFPVDNYFYGVEENGDWFDISNDPKERKVFL